jgi:hypothetical protein
VFGNRVLKRIFGPKGEEPTGGWRKLYNEEVRNLYSNTYYDIIKEKWMARAYYMHGREKCMQGCGRKKEKEH